MPRRRRPVRPEPAGPEEAARVETVPADTLNLEPRGQPTALERRVRELQAGVEHRIAMLSLGLTGSDRRTLEDARSFLAQSNRASEDGDWQRAWVLAEKARLIVAALERR